MITKTIKTIAVLMFAVVFTASAQLKEIGGFQNPESVIALGDKLYVTNLGAQLDPTAKDGDGFISVLNRKDGKMIQEKFISGLNSPKGMLAGHGYLLVTDVDKVLIFKIKTGKKVWEASLEKQGVTYANDMVKVCGGVLVSSTDKNAIYKINMKGKVTMLPVKVDLPGANGLAKGCGKLFVANYGRGNNTDGSFGKVGLCNKKFTALQNGGMYDGIVKKGHCLIVTDWVSATENKGRLVAYSLCKKQSAEINIGRTINGPADIYKDCKTKTLWVPAMRENQIIGVPYDMIKKSIKATMAKQAKKKK
ncbi:MAG TPA: hypothetical protein VK174_08090 [Chitinophagales bacterium]|nr:hypothetical protein [Chitinophagales bacterium]